MEGELYLVFPRKYMISDHAMTLLGKKLVKTLLSQIVYTLEI